MQDIYFGMLGGDHSLGKVLDSLTAEVTSADETLLNDQRFLQKLDKMLGIKMGVDKDTLAELKKEHQENQKTYTNLFEAMEDELIAKGNLKMQLKIIN